MKEVQLHYGWIVILMGLLTAIAAHGFTVLTGKELYEL